MPEKQPDELTLVRTTAEEAISRATAFAVTTAEDYKTGIEALQQIKRLRKKWNDRVRPSIRAAKAAHDETLKLLHSVDDPLADAYDRVKELCEAWVTTQRLAAQQHYQQPVVPSAALESAFDAAVATGDTAKAAKILEEAASPIMHMPSGGPRAPVAPYVPKVEGASVTNKWTYDVIDESAVPLEFKMLDHKRIATVVNALGEEAAHVIPGIRVRPDLSLRIRQS